MNFAGSTKKKPQHEWRPSVTNIGALPSVEVSASLGINDGAQGAIVAESRQQLIR
jgi:hypothetical protein